MRPLAFAFALLLTGCFGSGSEDANVLAATDSVSTAVDWPSLTAALPCDAEPSSDDLTANLRHLVSDPVDHEVQAHREEIDMHAYENATLLAASRLSGAGGFDLLDVSDPTAPRHIAGWAPPSEHQTGFEDLKFLPDGSGVVHSSPAKLVLVDVRDPRAPKTESVYELGADGLALPGGAHMVATWALDGAAYVSISKGEGSDLSIFRVVGAPGARTLERIAHPALTPLGNELPREGLILFETRSHDTWFERDPESGTPILWVANAYWGVVALDVTDPAAPKEIARFANEGAMQGYVHQAQVTHLDGKRLVVTVTEYGRGSLQVWDATDLGAPKLVAVWTPDLPTKPSHNLQVVGQYAYVAHFQDGLFVFDLARASDGALTPVAHAPAQEELDLVRVPAGYAQKYEGPVDVHVQDGIVWLSELRSGVHAFAFGCIQAGDRSIAASG